MPCASADLHRLAPVSGRPGKIVALDQGLWIAEKRICIRDIMDDIQYICRFQSIFRTLGTMSFILQVVRECFTFLGLEVCDDFDFLTLLLYAMVRQPF